jgi:hypothetical protein
VKQDSLDNIGKNMEKQWFLPPNNGKSWLNMEIESTTIFL